MTIVDIDRSNDATKNVGRGSIYPSYSLVVHHTRTAVAFIILVHFFPPFAGSDDEVNGTLANALLSETHPTQLNNPDGNDDATMAMIVDLLEANSGLGGAINYAGLPWPLP